MAPLWADHDARPDGTDLVGGRVVGQTAIGYSSALAARPQHIPRCAAMRHVHNVFRPVRHLHNIFMTVRHVHKRTQDRAARAHRLHHCAAVRRVYNVFITMWHAHNVFITMWHVHNVFITVQPYGTCATFHHCAAVRHVHNVLPLCSRTTRAQRLNTVQPCGAGETK